MVRKGPLRGRSGADVQKPRRREALQEVQPAYAFIHFTKERARPTTRRRRQQSFCKGDVGKGSRTLTKTPPSAHSSSTRGSAWQGPTDGPTDTLTGTAQGRSLVTMSALAAQRLQRVQRSFLLFLFPCLWTEVFLQKNQLVQVETCRRRTPQLTPPLLSSLVKIEFTFILILTGNLPSHAVSNAVSPDRRLLTNNF